MSDQGVCPNCGAPSYRLTVKQTLTGRYSMCNECQARGRKAWWASDEQALNAFCHPAHLLKDKALVDVDDLTEVLSILKDVNNPAIDRLWAQMREGMVK